MSPVLNLKKIKPVLKNIRFLSAEIIPYCDDHVFLILLYVLHVYYF